MHLKHQNIIIVLILISLFQVLIFSNSAFSLPITNILFVDGLNWFQFVANRNFIADFDAIKSSHLFLAFYFLLYSVGGLSLIYLFNLAYFLTFFSRVSLILILLFSPFYIVNLYLPSKDLLLLFPLLAYVNLLFSKKYSHALFLSIIIFFIRDGFGLLLFVLAIFSYYNTLNKKALFFLIAFFILLDFFMLQLNEIFPTFMLSRVLHTAQEGGFHSYLIRLFGTITNLSSRMVFITDSGNLSMTGIALFLSGLPIFTSFLISIRIIFSHNTNSYDTYISFIFLYSAVLLSFSPLIQPRYLIPISLFHLHFLLRNGVSNKRLFKYLSISFFGSIMLMISYELMMIGNSIQNDFSLDYLQVNQ